MCYSAQVWDAYQKYQRTFGAKIDFKEFVRLYGIRNEGGSVRTVLGMDRSFAVPETPEEQQIKSLIDAYELTEKNRLELEMFQQKQRLVEAERKLAVKETKVAAESKRIATDKIERARSRLTDLTRTDIKGRDSRIYPGYHVPVMIWRDGSRTVVPMRYRCRPAGKPAFYDTKYPGTYNARRDNLEGFWKAQFGATHGIMVVNRFYEHVDGKVLEFAPKQGQDMLVACLWSHWTGKGEPDLYSFAAITDEPPAEVAAAGHDRCIIPIKPENVDAWLNPEGRSKPELWDLLDNRERPYYEHRLAA